MNKNNTLNNDAINYMVDYYDANGTLPTNYIECTITGEAYTCFGTNLKKKIEKAGDIRTLLTTFVGRGAKKALPKADKITGRKQAKVTVDIKTT
jgi:hypothetical protein